MSESNALRLPGEVNIGELDELQSEIATWAEKTNVKQRGVDWQFKIDDAHLKLKRLYPRIKT